MKFKILSVFLLSALFPLAVHSAGIITKTEHGIGEGNTRSEAIEIALEEALGKATGIKVTSDRSTSRQSSSAITSTENKATGEREDSASQFSEGTQRHVQSKVQGFVKGYQVLRAEEIRPGIYQAEVEADVSVYEAGKQTERQRIAVIPFELGTRSVNSNADPYLERLRQSCVDYLTATRHFAVLDRDFTAGRLNELEGLMRQDARAEDRARLGNSLGTDYILTGKITRFDVRPFREKTPYTQEVSTLWKGPVNITWRVLEASTGQVLLSESSDYSVKAKDEDGFLKAGAREGRKIAEKLTSIIFPMPVVSFSNGMLTIARGGKAVRPGKEYTLIRYGAFVEDPYTGEKGARDEIPVGRAVITDVTPKVSHARVLECQEDLTGLAPREYILREAEPREYQSQANKKKPAPAPAW